MKKIIFSTILILLCISCEKEEFDIKNPDVDIFVRQIKSGTYDCYEKGEDGENLWLIMPKFTQSDIQSLINYSKDTTHITDFPVNPMSSRRPFPEGREYFVLGECLLWIVEGIRNDQGFGSLDPFLIDTSKIESERFMGLKSYEILMVRDLYKDWWKIFKDNNWQEKNPLEGTSYRWF